MDELLSPADQRILVGLWARQPQESLKWTLTHITDMFESDPEIASRRLWLPLTLRQSRSRLTRLHDRLTRPFRRQTIATAATALEAAALAFAVRRLINERQFALLTDSYRIAARTPIELARTALDTQDALRSAMEQLRERSAA